MGVIPIIAASAAVIILAVVAVRGRTDVAASAVAVSERPVAAVKAPVVPIGIIMRWSRGSGLRNNCTWPGFVDHICGIRRLAHES